MNNEPPSVRADLNMSGVAVFTALYIAFYIPEMAGHRVLAKGLLHWDPLKGVAQLPAVALGSSLAMLVAFLLLGWWRHLDPRERERRLNGWNFVSGLCSAVTLVSVTLAFSAQKAIV